MMDRALAALFVLAIWWISTGLVLGMVWLGRGASRKALAVFSLLGLGGLVGLRLASSHATATGAYVGFTSALAVWAWHELTFLLGVVTGPRKEPCPPDARGWRRFGYATAVVIHHEVALAVTALVVVGLSWGAPNPIGTWTFLVLWVMRLSAKLNVFLGVRNVTEEFIPVHLRYVLTYFRRAKLNPLMPVSVLAASAVAVLVGMESLTSGADSFVLVGRTLVATMLGLAVVEHLFLALPLPDALLWRWVLAAASARGRP